MPGGYQVEDYSARLMEIRKLMREIYLKMDCKIDGDFEEDGIRNFESINNCLDRWDRRRKLYELGYEVKEASKKRTPAQAGIQDIESDDDKRMKPSEPQVEESKPESEEEENEDENKSQNKTNN